MVHTIRGGLITNMHDIRLNATSMSISTILVYKTTLETTIEQRVVVKIDFEVNYSEDGL